MTRRTPEGVLRGGSRPATAVFALADKGLTPEPPPRRIRGGAGLLAEDAVLAYFGEEGAEPSPCRASGRSFVGGADSVDAGVLPIENVVFGPCARSTTCSPERTESTMNAIAPTSTAITAAARSHHRDRVRRTGATTIVVGSGSGAASTRVGGRNGLPTRPASAARISSALPNLH